MILSSEVVEANRLISGALGVPLASQVYKMRILYVIDGEPELLQVSYIPYARIQEISDWKSEDQFSYKRFEEQYDRDIVKRTEEIMLVKATGEEERELCLKKDSEVLMVKGTSYDRFERIVEYYEMVSATDFYVFCSTMIEE